MSGTRTLVLTALTMIAFAGNSILCRTALLHTGIDAASFTAVRLFAGAVTLVLIVQWRFGLQARGGNWLSAAALFAYAGCFSFAYVGLSASTGALLLFGAVQVTMIGYGLFEGERPGFLQAVGMAAAGGGIVLLLLPGLSAPPLQNAVLMLLAGAGWGLYSLRGRGRGNPTIETAGNFLRAVPFALVLILITLPGLRFDAAGIVVAVVSGAVASALGYVLWYTALPGLTASRAATAQLSVPVITAIAGVLLLSESVTLRLVLASVAVLGGIALGMRKAVN